jgi:DNA-binding transcriptional regulator YiaG
MDNTTNNTPQLTAGQLRAWRDAHKTASGKALSRVALADILGVKGHTYENWEYGRSRVPAWLGRTLDLIEIANGGNPCITLYPERPHGNTGRPKKTKTEAAA